MAYVTTADAKAYLRVDSGFEDTMISGIVLAAESKCRDIARMDMTEWDAVASASSSSESIAINETEYTGAEQVQLREIIRVAILYTVGYLFEHRTEADHHDLDLTLRCLLSSIREGVF